MSGLTGKRIDDYLLRELLGRGSFGEVYLAEHVHHKQLVAIKILNFQLNTENMRPFLEEVRSFRLEHPNIMRVKDFGVVSGLGVENGRPYIVMNYTPYGNLRQRHPSGACLAWKTIVPYVKQLTAALQYVHDEGLVHRDIKPENMLIGLNGELLLSDFGIATPSSTWRPGIPQKAMGTPAYVPPEQISGQAVRASDQYALGVVMYEWLTGEPVFTGTVDWVVYQHMNTDPLPPSHKVPAISPQIEAIIMRMLAKDPHDRFTNMREFAAAVDLVNTGVLIPRELVFTAHTEAVLTVAWSPDGNYIASAGRDKLVYVWQATTGDILHIYHEYPDVIQSVAWSPDSRDVASAGADGTVQVWTATTGDRLQVYTGHESSIREVAWSPSGTALASASEDGTLQIWEPVQGKMLCDALKHRTGVYTCTWSPDSNFVASGCDDGSVYIWEIATARTVQVYEEHTERVKAIAWSQDGLYIASAGYDHIVQVWNVETERPTYTYSGHTEPIAALAWSPDGRLLASAGWDKTIHVWQIDGGKEPFIYRSHENWVNALSWSPDSRYLVSGSWDKTVHIFSPSSLLVDA